MTDTKPVWHHGRRQTITRGRRAIRRWLNLWLTHPCQDLAEPWETGPRAAHPQPGTPEWDNDCHEFGCHQ